MALQTLSSIPSTEIGLVNVEEIGQKGRGVKRKEFLEEEVKVREGEVGEVVKEELGELERREDEEGRARKRKKPGKV